MMTLSALPPTDMLLLLLRRWRTLLISTSIGLALALLYGLLAPKWYEARLAVVPSRESSSALSSLASSLPGGQGGFGLSLNTDARRIEAVLTSTSVSDAVIEKFSLLTSYGADSMESARKELWRHCSTSVDRKSGVVSLTCEDRDATRALEIATYFGTEGNRVFGRISASSAREECAFLEAQVVKARRDVDETSRMLREFQEKNKVLDLGEQSKAVISAMASLNGDLLSKHLQLSYLTSFSAPTESNVVQLRQQVTILEDQLSQLELSRRQREGASRPTEPEADFFPPAMHLPELRFEFERLYREQKIAETVFFLLTQRHELARIDEARDTSAFQILDAPRLPTHHARPRLIKTVVFGALCGAVLAACWILLPGWWKRRIALPQPQP